MRSILCRLWVVVVLVLTSGLATTASAQSCLDIDACLLSPTRADAARSISPNGCSVPPEAGAIGQFWAGVFQTACNQHDIDWGTFKADFTTWFAQSNAAFYANMLATCKARVDLPANECREAADIFVFAVSATSIGQDFFKRAQYAASTCACRQLPTAPVNVTSQVGVGPTGANVSLQWTPGTDATSYAVEVVQPLLPAIDTRSPQPLFAATGVPNGQYRVQVRSINPLGVSSPSAPLDIVVGTAGPCAPPSAPALPTATFAAGVAAVTWPAVAGATSYIVRAGLQPGGSEIFNGNVGNTNGVSASGLGPGFGAFVRVYAVNSCGVGAASPEIVVGSVAVTQ